MLTYVCYQTHVHFIVIIGQLRFFSILMQRDVLKDMVKCNIECTRGTHNDLQLLTVMNKKNVSLQLGDNVQMALKI